jgi:hypothetical protein
MMDFAPQYAELSSGTARLNDYGVDDLKTVSISSNLSDCMVTIFLANDPSG